MNAKTRNQIRFGLEVASCMTYRREKIVANLLTSLGIFILGHVGNQYGLAITAISIVQTVNLPELVEAYKEAQTQPRVEYTEPEREREPRP
ncbi:hypothetical protein HATV-3_gp34 [Haloarcula tailed virus 3]|uniref:Uncharacterized protein n=1 Tax=Haloarcula tailed virus 3 TaxID=2877990 RepID=A0AAE8Y068_9CAUD|nr:hypothetical protein M1M35_gp34 [Haloarcula tailed virus 3]UBF23384.1 hypothetical protein HATV-3_gp34 [Haloarcula tailed virus 3]